MAEQEADGRWVGPGWDESQIGCQDPEMEEESRGWALFPIPEAFWEGSHLCQQVEVFQGGGGSGEAAAKDLVTFDQMMLEEVDEDDFVMGAEEDAS